MSDPPECIHISFHQTAERLPNAVCLMGDHQLSYAQVQRRVLLLAEELRQAGAKANTTIAVFMEPSIDYVISMLAILTAGSAYVPLELAYPTSMLQRVLQDAAPLAVVTTHRQRALLPAAAHPMAVVVVDQEQHPTDPRSLEELVENFKNWPVPSLDDLAFVVYSSGTTGQPKGIANSHRAPALSYNWRFDAIVDYAQGHVVAASVFFVWEALRPIMRGAAVVPVPSHVVFDGNALSEHLQRHKVTEMLFTPSLLENLFNTMEGDVLKERLASLKTIFLNGEVVSLALRSRCYQVLPQVRFINLYSISECHEVGAADLADIDLSLSTKFCPIGKPCSVSPAYILDEEEEPVEVGTAGELYIGGDMLAIGYLNLPELTKTRFVDDPFWSGKRMYRTGDRARFLSNGQLEILGRCDFMVKIRGYSIVLGAVEAALQQAVALSSCVVVADGDEGQEKHLVAYIVRAEPNGHDTRLTNFHVDTRTGACPEIRRAVDGVLPHYMVPSVYIEVETLPVSAVGAKLDRKALQAQSSDRRAMLRSLQLSSETHTTAHAAPGVVPTLRWKRVAKYLKVDSSAPIQDIEDAMTVLWEVVLERDLGTLSADSSFHEQGGHSLSAARLASMIHKVFGERLSVVRLLQGMTIRQCVADVMASRNSSSENDNHTVKQPLVNGDGAPTTPNGEKGNGAASANYVESPTTVAEETILQQVREAAVLPEDVQPKTGAAVRGLADSKSILLTGATGFLGAHVLAELLHKFPSASVMCLVRSADKAAVETNLEKYKLANEEFSSHIVVIKGDLSLPKLGLSESAWEQTASTVDAIVHCGAAVSLTAPYSMLEPANVGGTLEVLRLACACKAGTPVVHVSSNGIFPRDKGSDEIFLENNDVACLPGRLGAYDGYGLSKWAAERLVAAAHKRGLPTMTIRFGNIGGQSTTGIGNALDFQGMILNGCRRLGVRPAVEGWQLEVTPVDFAATAMVALAENSTHLSAGAIFHCVQAECVNAERVFAWIAETDCVSMPALPFREWAKKVEEAGNDDENLSTLQAFTMGLPEAEAYLSRMAYLDCSKFDAAIAKLEPRLARLTPSDVASYYRVFLLANHVIPSSMPSGVATKPVAVDPAASGAPVGPLANKVAVVTGASSGIGRAIVISLVKAGCNVAMGARRLGELEKLQKELTAICPGSSVKTLCVRTDVTKREDVAALVKSAEVSLGLVDILVNCAGVMYFTLMKNVVWNQWDAQVDVNCKGTMYGIGTVLPGMLQRGKGHIVNITSDAGRKAFPGLGVYSGSKFFIEAVSQALRAETASTGLRVTCIQPGNVETPLLSKSTDPEGLAEYGTPTGAKVLEPSDIGRAVVYALSQPEWCAVNEILVEPREEPA